MKRCTTKKKRDDEPKFQQSQIISSDSIAVKAQAAQVLPKHLPEHLVYERVETSFAATGHCGALTTIVCPQVMYCLRTRVRKMSQLMHVWLQRYSIPKGVSIYAPPPCDTQTYANNSFCFLSWSKTYGKASHSVVETLKGLLNCPSARIPHPCL